MIDTADEEQFALMEAERNASSDNYFLARPQIDTTDRRRVFEAGFTAAWKHLQTTVTENAKLRRLLARYRDETPLGHQPHMIAHKVDEALGRVPAGFERRGEMIEISAITVEIQKLTLMPGDILVLRFNRILNREQADLIREELESIRPDGVKMAVLDSTCQLQIVEPPNASI